MTLPNLPLARRAELVILTPILVLASCDNSRSGRTPVYRASGIVTLDGRPLDGATVTFQPSDSAGKPGHAVTDASGRFTATTFEPGDGLTAGSHRVSIQKSGFVDKQGNVVREIREPGDVKEVLFVPKKYGHFETSGIEVQVAPVQVNEFAPFHLTTDKN